MFVAMDGSHNVALLYEHGVEHLVFFHAQDARSNEFAGLSNAGSNEEHHELHLSSATNGLMQKKLQVSLFTSEITLVIDPMLFPGMRNNFRATPFEPDVGAVHRSISVLRI